MSSDSLTGSLLKGTGWTVGIRWMSKFLGLISLAICARYLTPADYGLVNMAMVVIGFSQVLVEFGLDASLIRNQNATREHYATAWSLKIIQSVIIGLFIFSVAIPVGHWLDDARVPSIMMVIGGACMLAGFQNIYVVNFRKTLNFQMDFLFSFLPRLTSFLATLVAVIVLRDYWGLVIGIATGEVSRLVISYLIIRQRARWSLLLWREMTSFSLWYLLSGLAGFIVQQLDRLFVGRMGGAGQVGLYGVAREVASLPGTELVMPIGRVLLPTLSTLNDDPQRQAKAIEKALAGVTLISVPISIGFVLVAHEFVLLVFGSQWMEAVPLVMIFCLGEITAGFRNIGQNVLVVLGEIKTTAALSWGYAAGVLLGIYPVYQWGGVEGLAWMYAVSGLIFAIVLTRILRAKNIISGLTLTLALARVLVAVLLMYGGVKLLAPFMPEEVFISLLCKAAVGAGIYTLSIYLLWQLFGKPDSVETVLIDMGYQTTQRIWFSFKSRA